MIRCLVTGRLHDMPPELLNSPKGRLFPRLRCTKFKIIPIIMN